MAGVFISYRRDDSRHITDRLADRLVERFGRRAVFKDVDSVPLGTDFRRVLEQAVGACRVLLAVIGTRWLTVTDESGRRRLDSELDFVRIEIQTALDRGLPVIPILVDGARIPAEAALPTGLQPLAYRQGMVLRPDPDFRADADRLIQSLVSHGVGEAPRQLRVLLLDAEEFPRRAAERFLEKEGYRCTTTANTAEAIAAFEAETFDLVLIQGQLGGTLGCETAEAIRRVEQGRGTAAVLLGMTGDAAARGRCLAAGMDGVIQRPLQPAEFQTAVRHYLDVIDWAHAREQAGHDEELVAELAAVALVEAPKTLAEIRAALADGKVDLLRRRAHLLKGCFGYFAARAAVEVAYRLQKADDLAQAVEAMPALERITARFLAQLSAYQPRLPFGEPG